MQRWELGDALRIGRSDEMDCVLEGDGLASRHHCTIQRSGRAYRLEDRGSKNGTFVDGERVTTAALAPFQLVRAGDALFTVASIEADAGSTLVGVSEPIQELRRRIALMAPLDVPVLLVGETGTGKEVAATELHRRSGRAGAFVAVNAAAIASTLAESTLFGHMRGAFSGADRDHKGVFETAAEGTLFLDEIGDMDPALQAKLLRVLETKDYTPLGSVRALRSTARVIAATHRDLDTDVAKGRFRSDLLARIGACRMALPPLRDRRADVVPLAVSFCRAAAKGRDVVLSAALLERLAFSDWPHNARGVRSVIQTLLAEQPAATRLDIGAIADLAPARSRAIVEPPADAAALTEVLRQERGNVAAVAAHYGCSRRQVYHWLERFGLDATRFRGGEG
ncbi:MAG: sigma 54-interacting transcriptional regulator [Deltaproteobacteria bacterium]|nr:sigma 54-interacting transcriptional regulator [Deltaproteobacteria bacterium]